MGWTDYIPQVAAYNWAKDKFGPPELGDPPSEQFQNSPWNTQAVGAITAGMQGANGRAAPTIDPAFRNAQIAQMGQLQGIANGTQQGAGELGVQRQVGNALASQQGLARMARGSNAGLAQRGAAGQSAAIGLSGAGMSQQAALQDQQMAHGMLSQLTSAGRQGDLGVGQLQQNQMGMNDQAQLGYLSQLTGLSIAQLQAQAAEYAARASQPSFNSQLLSAGGQIGAAAAKSDERLKTEISEGGDDIDEMLDGLRAKRYRYKDEKWGQGSRVGIMAQDMERSRAGRDVVRDKPDGKELDINAALSAALASSARLNERLRKLEKGKAA